MSKFIINNDDELLAETLVNADDGDIIELLPGTYFSKESPFVCDIGRNITLQGKTTDRNTVKINGSFTVGKSTVIIFKNLTIDHPANDDNTFSAYDGAEIYFNNVCIDRSATDGWDTIYGQNSTFSFKDSQVLTGRKTKAIGLSLDNSQIFADNTSIQLMLQKSSKTYLKDSIVTDYFDLRKNSQVNFNNLTIDSKDFAIKNDLLVKSTSKFNGQQLHFSNSTPNIRIHHASFDVKNLEPKPDQINFKFDNDSNVKADGKQPVNNDKKMR